MSRVRSSPGSSVAENQKFCYNIEAMYKEITNGIFKASIEGRRINGKRINPSIRILVEDDGNWIDHDFCFDVHYLDNLIELFQEAKRVCKIK